MTSKKPVLVYLAGAPPGHVGDTEGHGLYLFDKRHLDLVKSILIDHELRLPLALVHGETAALSTTLKAGDVDANISPSRVGIWTDGADVARSGPGDNGPVHALFLHELRKHFQICTKLSYVVLSGRLADHCTPGIRSSMDAVRNLIAMQMAARIDYSGILSGVQGISAFHGRAANSTRKITLDQLSFHENDILISQFMIKAGLSIPHEEKRDLLFRQEKNCDPCLYGRTNCRDRPGSCTLTLSDLVKKYPNTNAARLWMGMHFFCGDRYEPPGKPNRHMVLTAPTPDRKGYIVRSLSPPFKAITVPIGDFALSTLQKIEEHALQIGSLKIEWQAALFSALWEMHERWMPDKDAFFKQSRNGTGRSSRNDILFIMIEKHFGELRIIVGSDTLASQDGGMNRKGDPIKPTQRPRFNTFYRYPYTGNIYEHTGHAMGARGSSSRDAQAIFADLPQVDLEGDPSDIVPGSIDLQVDAVPELGDHGIQP